MIVPRTPLLLWTALIVVPFAAMAGAVPGLLLPALAIIALFTFLVIADALRSRIGLHGLTVTAPEVARLQKDRPGELKLLVRNEPQTARHFRLGLAFPPAIGSPRDDLTAALPDGALFSRLSWPCVGNRRGRYLLSALHLEARSPLGWWAYRSQQPLAAEIRVYPNLEDERKNVAALFLNRGHVGIHAIRQVGKGREFEKLREYVHGDSSDDIHWKASAKRGHPVTKVFQIERTQEIYVVIDASRLSARSTRPGELDGTASTPLLERYVTAAMILGVAAQQQGDLFGVLTFTDRVHTFVRARSGKAHFDACRDAIYGLQPETVTPDFEEVCSFIRLRLRKRALLLVLTALDDPMLAQSFVRSMDLIRRQHLILVNMLTPPGAEPLFSSPAVESIDDLYGKLSGHLQWHDLRELEKVLQRRGVQFHLLDHERMTAQLLAQYMEVKARQLV